MHLLNNEHSPSCNLLYLLHFVLSFKIKINIKQENVNEILEKTINKRHIEKLFQEKKTILETSSSFKNEIHTYKYIPDIKAYNVTSVLHEKCKKHPLCIGENIIYLKSFSSAATT